MQMKPLSELSVDDVIHLLESLKLSKYCYNFEENDIDGPTLMNCQSVDDVKELGIALTAKGRLLHEEIVKFKSSGVPLTLLSEVSLYLYFISSQICFIFIELIIIIIIIICRMLRGFEGRVISHWFETYRFDSVNCYCW